MRVCGLLPGNHQPRLGDYQHISVFDLAQILNPPQSLGGTREIIALGGRHLQDQARLLPPGRGCRVVAAVTQVAELLKKALNSFQQGGGLLTAPQLITLALGHERLKLWTQGTVLLIQARQMRDGIELPCLRHPAGQVQRLEILNRLRELAPQHEAKPHTHQQDDDVVASGLLGQLEVAIDSFYQLKRLAGHDLQVLGLVADGSKDPLLSQIIDVAVSHCDSLHVTGLVEPRYS